MASTLLFLITFYSIYSSNSETIYCNKGQSCQCIKNNACYIICEAKDACKGSDITLTCKAGYPCTIKCIGTAACQDALLDGSKAQDVTVICLGKDACKGSSGTIICGSGNCLMECTGDAVCVDTYIDTKDAKSFQCTGGDCPQKMPEQYSHHPTPTPATFPTMTPITLTTIDIYVNDSQTTLSSAIELMTSPINSSSSYTKALSTQTTFIDDTNANNDDDNIVSNNLIVKFAGGIKKRLVFVVLCLLTLCLCMCLVVYLFKRREKKQKQLVLESYWNGHRNITNQREMDTVESDSDGDNNNKTTEHNTLSDVYNVETNNDGLERDMKYNENQGLSLVNQNVECFDDSEQYLPKIQYDYDY